MFEAGRVKVLLVENDPGDARPVEILLSEVEATSFEVTRVGLLSEALEHLNRSGFDVVLLDLSLPDSSGLETVDLVRLAAPRMPVVVLSSRDDEEIALRALRGGAEDYLVKGRGDVELVTRAIRYAIERKRAEERLAYLAQYDHLTGLANRTLFRDRLKQAAARADRGGGLIALMFLDLDRFKAVNDTLGHACGDELLKTVARRIKNRVRGSDTVARLGGDQFAIILEGMSDVQDAAPLAREILEILSRPLVLAGREIFTTASIGISAYPHSQVDDLITDADAAVYRAKERGRNNYEFYTREMNVQAFERLALESSLRMALNRNEYVLYYQPQIELATGRIVGAEALLRWRHPDLGLVSPANFIPVLEETGLIVRVGEWVLRTACHQGKAWQEAGLAPLRIAVNLSARQFGREDLVGTVDRVLSETGLDPARLELEITESLLMDDIRASSQALGELKKTVGAVRVSIDDFGTGYSSLSYLKSFPIDLLKIAQPFVRDIVTDPDDAAITTAIIGLAHNLRLKVIAEGVETEEQLAYLSERGCDEAQGFYLGRPLPPDEFAKLLKGREEENESRLAIRDSRDLPSVRRPDSVA